MAEANKRIITGSKEFCKSVPSAHGGFCIKQSEAEDSYGRAEKEKRRGEG